MFPTIVGYSTVAAVMARGVKPTDKSRALGDKDEKRRRVPVRRRGDAADDPDASGDARPSGDAPRPRVALRV